MLNPAIALLAWPVVAIWLFARLPFERAIIWSVIAPFLILPAAYAIDLPGLPPLSKESLPSLVLLGIVIAVAPRRFRLLPGNPIAKLLLLLLIFGAIATVLTNQDPIWVVGRVLPGQSFYDALSSTVRTLLFIAPILVGWQYLADADAHREILKAFVAAGLFYSLPMLFEVRMSPQLHTWVYGYFPSSFLQQIRAGGFRPVVFIGHGLGVAFFALAVCIAAAGLWRDAKERAGTVIAQARGHYLVIAAYMLVVLILCKSLGSLVYAILCLPAVLFLKIRTQMLIAAILAAVTLTYPALRGADLVPTETLLEWAEAAGPDRVASLTTRFDNEKILLDHAENRIVFGWGGWGRNRVYDAESGKDDTITDGYWVIVIGTAGWAGYIATFGLLCLPLLVLWFRIRRHGTASLSPATGALCILYGINLLDLLPNAGLFPWTWLIGGALLGHAAQQVTSSEPRATAPEGAATVPRTVL